MVVRADRRPGAGPGTFLAEDGDRSGLFVKSTVGAGVTLTSGRPSTSNITSDANGYSSREWGEITGLIVENDEVRMDERFASLPPATFCGSGPGSTDSREAALRVLRMQHPELSGDSLAAEMTVLHNLADHSGSLACAWSTSWVRICCWAPRRAICMPTTSTSTGCAPAECPDPST